MAQPSALLEAMPPAFIFLVENILSTIHSRWGFVVTLLTIFSRSDLVLPLS